MKNLLIATRSKGKFPEIIEGLKDLPFKFLNLNDIPEIPKGFEVEETATTIEGNAILKAKTLGQMTGLLTLADDTGLEVDALNGRPGVYTARYAPGTDQDRYLKLLEELKDTPREKRTARFRCTIAIYNPEDDKLRTCEGLYEGKITNAPIGEKGFGYDSVFYNTELNKTSAQMNLEEKNLVSHRGKALRKAKEILRNEF